MAVEKWLVVHETSVIAKVASGRRYRLMINYSRRGERVIDGGERCNGSLMSAAVHIGRIETRKF